MTQHIPIISISGLFSPLLEDRLQVAMQMKQACEDNGFFYIADHGVSKNLQQKVFEQSRQFLIYRQMKKKKFIRKTRLPIVVMNR